MRSRRMGDDEWVAPATVLAVVDGNRQRRERAREGKGFVSVDSLFSFPNLFIIYINFTFFKSIEGRSARYSIYIHRLIDIKLICFFH